LEKLYLEQSGFDAKPGDEVLKSYEKFRVRLGFPETSSRKPRLGQRILKRVAAVVLPLALIGSAYWWFNGHSGTPEIEAPRITVFTEHLEQRTLSDGSDVWVNTRSTIRYAEEFTGERIVELEGEAFFSVTRDEEKPFIVKTGNLSVRVLGTEFNVTAYPEQNQTVVMVRSGQVEIETGSGKELVNKGNMVEFDHLTGKTSLHPIPPGVFRDWRMPDLIFENASLEEIFTGLGKSFNMKIVLDPAFSDQDRFDLDFTGGETLEEALTYTRMLSGKFEYTLRTDTLFITRK
jgi:Fe2+-dicitrate sensor, membrane component